MNIYIPSHGRPHAPTVTWLLSGTLPASAVVVVLVDDQATADAYRAAGVVPHNWLHVSDRHGLVANRAYVDQLEPLGTYYISLDDNLRDGLSALHPDLYGASSLPQMEAAKVSAALAPISPARFLSIASEARDEATRHGAAQAGFSFDAGYRLRTAPRTDRYHPVRHVMSKACIRCAGAVAWDPTLNTMEEYGYTGENLLHYGRQPVNQYVTFQGHVKHYDTGGIGSYEWRMPHKKRESAYLLRKYAGLFTRPARKTADPEGELRLALHTPEAIDAWRAVQLQQVGLGL